MVRICLRKPSGVKQHEFNGSKLPSWLGQLLSMSGVGKTEWEFRDYLVVIETDVHLTVRGLVERYDDYNIVLKDVAVNGHNVPHHSVLLQRQNVMRIKIVSSPQSFPRRFTKLLPRGICGGRGYKHSWCCHCVCCQHLSTPSS